MLDQVWTRARDKALVDRDAMQKLVAEEGGNFKLAPWDWRYYAEKLRKRLHDVDEASVKPYLQLDNVIEAAFDTAHRLFGLSFEKRDDIATWHPDVRVWDVKGPDGRHAGLFFGDYFARPSKHCGAWMTTLRDQEKLDRRHSPARAQHHEFQQGVDGAPDLLSYDDARTLFHEFGHGLHGLLSDVTYPMVSGTSVLTDWVELPSQLYEHWFERPEVLAALRAALQDRRADAGGDADAAAEGAQFQYGLGDGGICLVGADRSRIPLAGRRRQSRRL